MGCDDVDGSKLKRARMSDDGGEKAQRVDSTFHTQPFYFLKADTYWDGVITPALQHCMSWSFPFSCCDRRKQ